MPRITYGSVQTRRWLGFEAWQCAHSAVTRAGALPSKNGTAGLTSKDAVTEAVHRWCDELAARYLNPGEDFPADGGAPSLFGDDGGEESPILQPGELSSTPKVSLARDVTRISGPVLERARGAVAVLRQREDPELLLMGFVDAAVLRLVTDVETRYPELSQRAAGLPKSGALED